MASPDNQQLWIPYDLNRDCSQRFCSIYCPQWCYIIFPPPPPFDFPDQDSGSKFSPLVIAIIGILAGVFLLVSYYTIIIKNCGNFDALRRRNQRYPDEDLEENRSSLQNEAWHVTTTGLEEALIKSITVCKYKKDGGLVEGTDCSVCLSEFQEDESLRLLPKCSHAFHLPCIDTWLQSHSNCPLCRANIVSTTNPPHLPSPEEFSGDGSSPENQSSDEMGIVVDGYEEAHVELGGNHELEEVGSFKGVSDDDGIIEIRDDEVQEVEQVNRSRVSIADVLGMMNSDDDFPVNGYRIPAWSKRCLEEQSRGKMGREDYTNKILHSVRAPVSMKRSFSGGKLLFTRNGRGKNGVIPV